MGLIELIIAVIIFLIIANIVLALIPIPNGIAGVIVVLVLFLLWRLFF
jgi:hypothetical protein